MTAPASLFLSQTAEYALRAMSWMALLPPGQAARAQDVSVATGIPLHYAAKVMRRMAAQGLLVAQRGHGGGYRLAFPPEQIRFADVLGGPDGALNPDHCAFGWGPCQASMPCPLHDAWSELKNRLQTWANQTTLADVRRSMLQRPPAKKDLSPGA